MEVYPLVDDASISVITELADGDEEAVEILNKVYGYDALSPSLFLTGAEPYPCYFRGERIVKIAEILNH